MGGISMKEPILYIDDEAENLRGFQFIFKQWYNVHITINPEEALDIIKKHHIKVVFSDQRMPNITGVELLSKIANEYPQVVRILITAYTDYESTVKAINDASIWRYISKPWIKEEVKLIIDNALFQFNTVEAYNRSVSELNSALSKISEIRELVSESSSSITNNKSDLYKRFLPYQLSQTQMRVLELILQNKRTDEICNILCINKSTLKSHRNKIYGKTHVTGINGLIKLFS